MWDYLWFIEVLTIVTGIVLAISNIDDLFLDLNYWIGRLVGSTGSRSRELPDSLFIASLPERPFAVMIPCWKEHEVIFSMLSSNSRLLRYRDVHYFVGTYQNDFMTQQEVVRAQVDHPNIHLIVVPRDGPTSKADCLEPVQLRRFFASKPRTRSSLPALSCTIPRTSFIPSK